MWKDCQVEVRDLKNHKNDISRHQLANHSTMFNEVSNKIALTINTPDEVELINGRSGSRKSASVRSASKVISRHSEVRKVYNLRKRHRSPPNAAVSNRFYVEVMSGEATADSIKKTAAQKTSHNDLVDKVKVNETKVLPSFQKKGKMTLKKSAKGLQP